MQEWGHEILSGAPFDLLYAPPAPQQTATDADPISDPLVLRSRVIVSC